MMVLLKKHGSGLHLNVYAYSDTDIKRLLHVLRNKLNLKCNIHGHSGHDSKKRIYQPPPSYIILI